MSSSGFSKYMYKQIQCDCIENDREYANLGCDFILNRGGDFPEVAIENSAHICFS